MKDRIKEIRKAAKMTQDEFASALGLTRSLFAQAETGKCSLSDRTIKDICKKFYINEEWLRNGEGEMYSENRDEVAEIVSRFMDNEDDEFNQLLLKTMKAYMNLSEQDKRVIMNFVEAIIDGKKG